MICKPGELRTSVPVVFYKPIPTLTLPLKGREVIVEFALSRRGGI